jgi:hypothetical protein
MPRKIMATSKKESVFQMSGTLGIENYMHWLLEPVILGE